MFFIHLRLKCFDSNPYHDIGDQTALICHIPLHEGTAFFPLIFMSLLLLFSFKTVNNQPVEKVKISNNGALATGSRNLCDDMWGSDESTCGFDKDADGNAIWDSQVKRGVPHSLHNMSRVVHYLL